MFPTPTATMTSVLRSHRWRTAENSAAYLLGHLRPGMALLDVGCGPGTITCDLARLVAPGRVIGIDASAEIIAEATGHAAGADSRRLASRWVTSSTWSSTTGRSMWSMPTRCSNMWETLWRPWPRCDGSAGPGALSLPVTGTTRPLPTSPRPPDGPGLRRLREPTRRNGANWDAGRRLLHWALGVGFASVVPSASTWCFATPDERAWWGDLWADRFTESALADQLLAHGIATREDLSLFAAAYRRWAAAPGGLFAIVHGEVICTV